jgi:hypothetical protein
MLAMDMLHLHPGVPHHYVEGPDNLAAPNELRQLAIDAAQVVAQQAAAMMQRWFETCGLEGILLECKGTAAFMDLCLFMPLIAPDGRKDWTHLSVQGQGEDLHPTMMNNSLHYHQSLAALRCNVAVQPHQIQGACRNLTVPLLQQLMVCRPCLAYCQTLIN